jgi:hypothetical protein
VTATATSITGVRAISIPVDDQEAALSFDRPLVVHTVGDQAVRRGLRFTGAAASSFTVASLSSSRPRIVVRSWSLIARTCTGS